MEAASCVGHGGRGKRSAYSDLAQHLMDRAYAAANRQDRSIPPEVAAADRQLHAYVRQRPASILPSHARSNQRKKGYCGKLGAVTSARP